VVAFQTQAFIWATEIIHDQLFVYTQINLSDQARYNYISSIAKDDLLYITEKSGKNVSDFMSWSIIKDSIYEWQKGLIRFQLVYKQSQGAFDAVIDVRPATLPPASGRLLQTPNDFGFRPRTLQISSNDNQPKDYKVPTYDYISPEAKNTYFILFCIVYVLVILTMAFLICVRPFVKSLRNSVRCFWFAQNVMWFQYCFLFGFLAIEFKGSLDEILFKISDASLRYFGADLEINLTSNINQIQNGYYVGKYTGKSQTPYVLQKMFFPVIAYFIAFILSLLPLGSAKEIIVAIRAGIGYSYGVQFAFMCCVNFVAFFGAGVYNGYTILGTIIALVLLIMIWMEVTMMKLQIKNMKSNVFTVDKNLGMSAYDIIGESNDKKIRDYKNGFINEVDCLLLMAMTLGFLGRAFIIEAIVLILLGILAFVSIVSIKQQFKGPKLALAGVHILTTIAILIFYFLGREPSLGAVSTLTTIFMILFFILILVNIVIWILRLLDLLQGVMAATNQERRVLHRRPISSRGREDPKKATI
jgi:hypothetical protein